MIRRLLKELREIKSSPQDDVQLAPLEDNDLSRWRAVIRGPPDTPYEDGRFELLLLVPPEYPHRPPTVTFLTKIFHPNIHFQTGEICLDLLKQAWSGVYTLQAVCRAIIGLLSNPEAYSPLNCDCGNLLRSGDVRGYNSLARMYTNLYAKN
jgi:peroxin-4